MDRRLLAKAYDRNAEGYDGRFRELQRVKFRAAAPFLRPGPLDDVPRALAELARVLRLGGHLVVSFLAPEAPARFPLPVEARVAAGQDVVFALRKDSP